MRPKGYKPFSESSYEKFAPIEYDVMRKLQIHNCKVDKNVDKYGIDLIVYKQYDDIFIAIGGIEVESHSKYWGGYTFPFFSVHFLVRKKKYAGPNNFYLMTAADLKNVCLCPFDTVTEAEIIYVDSKYVTEEPIYDVPVELCIWGWKQVNSYLSEFFNKNE
jgi:hypothetical protein